jgi:fructose-1-phosphate kinase PfkB-like protein
MMMTFDAGGMNLAGFGILLVSEALAQMGVSFFATGFSS